MIADLKAQMNLLSPFERHLKRKHSLSDHWLRTNNELRRGYR